VPVYIIGTALRVTIDLRFRYFIFTHGTAAIAELENISHVLSIEIFLLSLDCVSIRARNTRQVHTARNPASTLYIAGKTHCTRRERRKERKRESDGRERGIDWEGYCALHSPQLNADIMNDVIIKYRRIVVDRSP